MSKTGSAAVPLPTRRQPEPRCSSYTATQHGHGTASARGRTTAVLDDRPVLESAPLRPGFHRHDLSRYGDPSWDLWPAIFRANTRRCHAAVHFGAIKDRGVREAVRDFLYVRLNIDIPGQRKRLAPGSIRQTFHHARRFFEFVLRELGSVNLHQANQTLLDHYARHLLQSRTRSPEESARVLQIVLDLHTYREHLSSGGLSFNPWHGRSTEHVAGANRAKENHTPRIPEAVIMPLLAWSIRYVKEFSQDIFAAREELDQLEARRIALMASDKTLPRERTPKYLSRLKEYLEQLRQEGRGVPVWAQQVNDRLLRHPKFGDTTPAVNRALLLLHAGTHGTSKLSRYLDSPTSFISTAIQESGVEAGGMDTPRSILPETGQPWRPRFDQRALVIEERMLQTAAYILCAYLTGMRDSEVQAMQHGCLSSTRSEDGLVVRHRIRSTIHKGKIAPGEPADWVTIEPVAKAVEVLERLTSRKAKTRGLATLWPVLATGERRVKDHLSAEIVKQLNLYYTHLNSLFSRNGQPAIPDGPGGKRWHLTTRQFRRTIAWHIANRPFGTIAGMIQYKHASVAAFEGYAGSSASGFRAEIDKQRALGQLDDILIYFDDHQGGGRLSGPAAPRISQALDATAAQLDPLPAMIADRARIRTMLASLARTLFVGVLADCFFDPGTAMCLKQASRLQSSTPMPALCQPTRCPNACITAKHRPAWARSADEVRILLKEKRLPSLQRKILEQELERLNDVLRGIEAEK